MFSILVLTGFIYSACAGGEVPDFEDFFSVFSNNNKYAATKSAHKATKDTKVNNSHEPFEMTLPLFYDLFPMGGLESRMKDSMKFYQEDRDQFQEGSEPRLFSKIFKQKKKPKDKVIMSFTEFFIPFTNRKTNMDIPGIPKKLDFIEDFFKDFPFREFEEPILKQRFQRKMINSKNTTKSQKGHNIENTSINSVTKKKDTLQKLDMLLHKPKETDIFLFQNGIDNLEAGPERQNEVRLNEACCGNPDCKNSDHCQEGMCTDRPPYDDDYMSKGEKEIYRVIEAANLDKLMRIALLYTVPILIGIGGIIIGIEVLRKHKNIVKNKPILKDYDPIQHC